MRSLDGLGRTSVMRDLLTDGCRPLTPANLLRYVLSNRRASVAIHWTAVSVSGPGELGDSVSG